MLKTLALDGDSSAAAPAALSYVGSKCFTAAGIMASFTSMQ